MALLKIGFTWWRDEAGYVLRAPRPANAAVGLLSADPAKIVGKSGQNTPYQITDRHSGHFIEFAAIREADDLPPFFRQHGPLTEGGLSQGEQISYALEQATIFRNLLTRAKRPKESTEMIDTTLRLTRLDVVLMTDKAGVHLQLTPRSLLGLMYLQLAQSMAGGRPIRACTYCGELFEAGKGTGRRLDAKFCSAEHQRLYNSLKRSLPPSAIGASK
jgi:hypothetical protein